MIMEFRHRQVTAEGTDSMIYGYRQGKAYPEILIDESDFLGILSEDELKSWWTGKSDFCLTKNQLNNLLGSAIKIYSDREKYLKNID